MAPRNHKPKVHRSAWQRLARAVVALIVLAGAAYVSFPLWFPARWVRDRLTADLSRQLGVEVTIERVRLSWRRGVEIENLQIASPPEFAGQTMLAVPRIQADLSPMDYLLRKRLAWMEVERPHLTVLLDEAGRVNLAPLGRLEFDVQTERISVRQARVSVHFANDQGVMRMDVSDLQYRLGRPPRLGSVTLSAEIDQQPSPAPVSAQLSDADVDSPIAAEALLTFADVDLAQLPIVKVLQLPLRELRGRCSGSVKLRLNKEGEVDESGLELTIRDLYVHPSGAKPLPTIDQAVLRATARWDLFRQAGSVLAFPAISVRLPGVDLTGHAALDLTSPAEGDGEVAWRGLHSLHLHGQVVPGQISALLTGREALGGHVVVDGPVALDVSLGEQRSPQGPAEFDEPAVPIRLSADATKATLRVGERVLKPSGMTLTGKLSGVLGRREASLEVDSGELTLGKNRFLGHGGIKHLRRRLAEWSRPEHRWTVRSMLDALGGAKWAGTWEIQELASLRALLGDLGGMRLRGRITGGWSFDATRDRRVGLSLNLPAETDFHLGQTFRKPTGKALTVSLGFAVEPDQAALRDVRLDVWLDTARASLSEGLVRLYPTRGPAGARTIDLAGKFDVAQVEHLLACLPPALGQTRVRGGLDGTYTVHISPRVRAGTVTADLTQLALVVPDQVRKQPGQPARLQVHFDCDASAPANDYAGRLTTAMGEATFEASLPHAGGPARDATCALRMEVRDAQSLAAMCPALPRWLDAGHLSGTFDLAAGLRWCGGKGAVDLRVDATDVAYASRRQGGSTKQAGWRARAWIRSRWQRQGDGPLRVELEPALVELPDLRLEYRGWALCTPEQPPAAGEAAPPTDSFAPPCLTRYQGTLRTHVGIGQKLRALLPPLREAARAWALSGDLTSTIRLDGTRQGVRLRAEIDATELTGTWPVDALALLRPPTPAPAPPGAPAPTTRPADPLRIVRKPAGLPARADLDLAGRWDRSNWVLHHLSARVGPANVYADGTLARARHADGGPVGPWTLRGTVRVAATDLSAVTPLVPVLEGYRLEGGIALSAKGEFAEGAKLTLQDVAATFTKVRGRYLGRPMALDGVCQATGVLLTPGERPHGPVALRADRVRTEALSFRVGSTQGWLSADLAGVPDAPKGRVMLSAGHVDEEELGVLLSGGTPFQAPPLVPSPDDLAAAEAQADAILTPLLPRARRADVTGQVRLGQLRTYDPAVGKWYLPRSVLVEFSVRKGQLRGSFAAGLNGGLMRTTIESDLTQEQPTVHRVADMSEILASDAFQPQLGKYFPGNTFSGNFSRHEDVRVSLRRFLAATLDTRYNPLPVGKATTVTTDGTLLGQAGPDWAAKLLPGLKTTKYDYRKMVARAVFRQGGWADNEMFFDGKTYDLRIHGTTDPKNWGRYTVALMLLGQPKNPPPSVLFQPTPVSVPLMKITARIEGGKMHDQKVEPTPAETFRKILLDNNISLANRLVSGAYHLFVKSAEILVPPKLPKPTDASDGTK